MPAGNRIPVNDLFALGLCLGLFLPGSPGHAQTADPGAELAIEQAVDLTRAYLNEVNPEKKQALLEQAGGQSVCDPTPFLQLLRPVFTNAEKVGIRHDVVVPLPGDGPVRSAVCSISLPAGYSPAQSYPLVIGLHGGGQDMGSGRDYMNSCRELASSDVVFVCPTSADLGVQLYWRNPLNEVMLMGLIKALGARYNIDRNRVYLVGYSMGGIGCYYLAPRMSEWFAGVAPGGGAWMGLHWPSLLNTAIYIWHGRHDNRGPQYTNYGCATNAAAYLGSLGTNSPHWTLRTMETSHGLIPQGEQRMLLRWLLQYKRDPYPDRIVMASPQALDFTSLALPAPPDRWLVIDKIGDRQLEMPGVAHGGDKPTTYSVPMGTLDATWAASNRLVVIARNVQSFRVRLCPKFVDFTKPLSIGVNGTEVLHREVKGSLRFLMTYLDEYRDPTMAYVGEVSVEVK